MQCGTPSYHPAKPVETAFRKKPRWLQQPQFSIPPDREKHVQISVISVQAFRKFGSAIATRAKFGGHGCLPQSRATRAYFRVTESRGGGARRQGSETARVSIEGHVEGGEFVSQLVSAGTVQDKRLASLMGQHTSPYCEVVRAKIILFVAESLSNQVISSCNADQWSHHLALAQQRCCPFSLAISNWIVRRDALFAEKATPTFDLYQGRRREHASLPDSARPALIEHEYERTGAWML